MAAAQLNSSTLQKAGFKHRTRNWGLVKEAPRDFSLLRGSRAVGFLPKLYCRRKTGANFVGRSLSLVNDTKGIFSSPVVHCEKFVFLKANSQLSSDYDVQVEGNTSEEEEQDPAFSIANGGLRIDQVESEFKKIPSSPSQLHNIKHEVVMLTLPAIAGQVIDPLVQLMETAYIGRLGSVELASAAVSMTLFNIISKLFNIPLLSVTTSFVAEDISKNTNRDSTTEKEECTDGKLLSGPQERQQLSSVSTALVLAIGIGVLEALALFVGSGLLLTLMGVSLDSPMHAPAKQFLILRALGAPAFVVSLALQGIFRGFKDTKTPVFCLGFGNLTAIFLFPLFIYYFRLGVSGAAISTVISQYIVTFSMAYFLSKKAILLPPKFGELQFGAYLKSGGFLIGRTLAVLITMTIGTSMATRQGPVAMAAHQICYQVWLAVALLTDALAASSQTLIASYLSKGDYGTVREITHFVLKIGAFTGISLAAVLGGTFRSIATMFTRDTEVLGIIGTIVLFVSASQPINALAFIFDGLHYGVSDFPYAAGSMMLVGAISSVFLLYAPRVYGLQGVWLGFTLFMGLRMVAGFVRIRSKESPWWFLHGDMKRAKLAG